jgi:hypothetical protein
LYELYAHSLDMPRSSTRKNKSKARIAPKNMARLSLAIRSARGLEAVSKVRQKFMRNLNQTLRRRQFAKKMTAEEKRKLKAEMKSAMMDTERELRRSSRLAALATAPKASARVVPAIAAKNLPGAYLYPSTLNKSNTRKTKNVNKLWKQKMASVRTGKTYRMGKPSANANINAEFANALSRIHL